VELIKSQVKIINRETKNIKIKYKNRFPYQFHQSLEAPFMWERVR